MSRRTLHLAVSAAGAIGASCWVIVTWAIIVAALEQRPRVWLIDWSVYLAGARDLADKSLYRQPLTDVGLPMSAPIFKLPPTAAVPALPFAWLDPTLGGVMWALLGALATATTAILVARMVTSTNALAWAGIGLGLLSASMVWEEVMLVGNINPINLVLIVGFVSASLSRHDRLAGGLLGLAIGIKLWPVALVVVPVRERRWRQLGWLAGCLAIQGVVMSVWLGPGTLAPMVSTAFTELPPHDPTWVFFVSWLAQTVTWWPAWGGLVVAIVLMALRLRGKAAMGMGILAGLALVTNLWTHYLPTFAVGLVMLLAGVREHRHLHHVSSARDTSRLA